jgi:putative colanic acid biosynthesis acetyltransferase WcaF
MNHLKYQDLSKFRVQKGFRGKSLFMVLVWRIIHNTFFRFSPSILNGWRRSILRLFGAKIGKKVLIRPSAKVLYPWFLEIGDNSWIGENVNLYNMAKITIGKYTVISQNSYLCTGNHDYTKKTFDIFAEPITIENEVWISSDVFVAPKITIGSGTVVGYRSTVTKDLPPDMLCYGNPAKPIKPR